jgi:chromosome segregation ATPase
MLRGMAQMDLKQRLKANRALSVTMSFLALVGWGGFAYSAGSSSVATRDLRAELAQPTAAQDQLRAERDQHQAAVGDLAQIQAKLASARGELDALARKREQATAQVAAVQQELMVLTKRRDERQAKGSEKGKVQAAKPSGKPARLAAQTKHQT